MLLDMRAGSFVATDVSSGGDGDGFGSCASSGGVADASAIPFLRLYFIVRSALSENASMLLYMKN